MRSLVLKIILVQYLVMSAQLAMGANIAPTPPKPNGPTAPPSQPIHGQGKQLPELDLTDPPPPAEEQLKKASAEKEKLAATVEDLQRQVDALTKFSQVANKKVFDLQASPTFEAFRLLTSKASAVKLRGFGSVQLVPLLDDYLVVIPPELAKQVDIFFSRIQRKVVVSGKAGTYLICDRKYFAPAPTEPASMVKVEKVTPPFADPSHLGDHDAAPH